MKHKPSVVLKLSIKFSAILTIAVLSIIYVFFMTLRHMSRQQETRSFKRTANVIARALNSGDPMLLEKKLSELPFFISYLIYDSNTNQIFTQRNGRIDILPETNGKTVHLNTKRTSGEDSLTIVYMTSRCQIRTGQVFTIQLAQNANTEAGNHFIRQVLLWIAAGSLPVLLLSFLLSIYFTKKTMEPVVKITKTAENISSSNLDKSLPETGKNDELDNLAKTFNKLFGRLKKDFDRERSFTGNVSHELKTPVAVISGQTNLLRRWGKNDPAQLDKSLEIIMQETKSIEAIITGMLELTRLENSKISVENQEFSVLSLFERLSGEFSSIREDVKIVFDKDNDTSVTSDPELLHQIFTAVISNSIKFSTENPVITLGFTKTQDEISFTVKDNGPGFREEDIPHVFERFWRGDKSHNRASGGSGLGLSITKALAQTLNGTVEASNSVEGGAVITVRLPA